MLFTLQQNGLQLPDILKRRSIRQGSSRLDLDLPVADLFGVSPTSGRVEVFEAKADHIHFFMAR